MKRPLLLISIASLAIVSCASSKKAAGNQNSFPKIEQNGKIAIAAHRGFWKCEEAANSQNSIASLSLAQENGFWGSECDIHLTLDGRIIVNHDNDIDSLKISEHSFEELSSHLLPNGERRPSFNEYLIQTSKAPKTKLVIEFKAQGSDERDEALIQTAIRALKARNLYSPERIAFISFSYYTCRRIAEIAPEFVNQYLNGDIAPAELAKAGINGIDYKYTVLYEHPEWIKEAHDLGMSVNVWTVNKTKDMNHFIEAGVDAITTNEPLKLRKLLGNKEYAN